MNSFKFFVEESNNQGSNSKAPCQVIQHDDMVHILSHAKPGSLVILDLDDTVGRVPQTIGLDAWFRFRMQQFINDGHDTEEALQRAIVIYNLAQLNSTHMIQVDSKINIAEQINSLKDNGVKVIALTARNGALRDKTLELLQTLGVSFSEGVLKDGSFSFDGKMIEIKDGVIFSDGRNKGLCLEQVIEQNYFVIPFESFIEVDFVDDSKRNCDFVAESSTRLKQPVRVWHYTYAECYLEFGVSHKERAYVQEIHLVDHGVMLDDDAAERLLDNRSL
ncbi:DUF2608 domain-containing protein [Legionella bononiensis]|uniref:DUF2608 domain-containing protein n=1 Tax=Legionella bononiensis TaxID=2793102 RepID=A0ABS1W9Z6_9GAMM|nr:DUF2608 domain-containing protein [Legionella bononiensis]MBL7480574.1 DUF2608 domain-containing protein [Legionella bononiensis]MBL7526187.1 DUF2608 domain-containing protein [Legionella bononiensis]MBL7563318.1 DUF2608 domain-containing protein [Legionella bononiensis]